MNTSPYRARPHRGKDMTEMQRSQVRVLLRVLYRIHGSWIAVARVTRIRRKSIEGFYHDDEPGNLALARAVAKATGLALDVALDGRFVVADRGVKAIGGK
ncbi:MAG: hypothetical protein IPM54_28095 [Polyangiaceae bacterium]|nr:hypothetical protein [Polyangiaceae bacterium]